LVFGVFPASPIDIITLEGFISEKKEGEHKTQEEIVKGEEPVGIDDTIGIDIYKPLEKIKATLGNDNVSMNQETKALFEIRNASIPSSFEPERKNEVSIGPL